MKRILSILVLLLAVFSLYGQEIVGSWSGVLTIPDTGMGEGKLTLVLHITAAENGYTCTMDSPDQNALGIATDTTTFEDKELTVKVGSIDFVYTGKLTDATTIDGSFTQMGQTYDLDLTRKEE